MTLSERGIMRLAEFKIMAEVGSEMYAHMNTLVSPQQKALGTDKFRYWLKVKHNRPPLGELVTLSDVEDEILDEHGEEFLADLTTHMLGWRNELGVLMTRRYTAKNPKGELGFVHRMDVWPITSRLFNLYEMAEFDVSEMNLSDIPGWARAELMRVGGEHDRWMKRIAQVK